MEYIGALVTPVVGWVFQRSRLRVTGGKQVVSERPFAAVSKYQRCQF